MVDFLAHHGLDAKVPHGFVQQGDLRFHLAAHGVGHQVDRLGLPVEIPGHFAGDALPAQFVLRGFRQAGRILHHGHAAAPVAADLFDNGLDVGHRYLAGCGGAGAEGAIALVHRIQERLAGLLALEQEAGLAEPRPVAAVVPGQFCHGVVGVTIQLFGRLRHEQGFPGPGVAGLPGFHALRFRRCGVGRSRGALQLRYLVFQPGQGLVALCFGARQFRVRLAGINICRALVAALSQAPDKAKHFIFPCLNIGVVGRRLLSRRAGGPALMTALLLSHPCFKLFPCFKSIPGTVFVKKQSWSNYIPVS